MSQGTLILLGYAAAATIVAVLVLRMVRKRRKVGPADGGEDKLKAFIDAYPDRAPAEPEPPGAADTCPRCGEPRVPGAVICGACGVICFFCGGRAEGRAGRDSYLAKCPRCGDFWVENSLSLDDYWQSILSGRARPASIRSGRRRPVFMMGISHVGEFTETNPLCECDIEMLEDGWSLEQVLERRRDRTDSG